MTTPALYQGTITGSIIGAFYEVYRRLGYGFLEHLYVLALEQELRARGHSVARQVGVRVWYRGTVLGRQRLDMIVDDSVVVEVKATHDLSPAAKRQLYSYLRGTNLEVGLLLHFGPKPEFHRIVCLNAQREQPNTRTIQLVQPRILNVRSCVNHA